MGLSKEEKKIVQSIIQTIDLKTLNIQLKGEVNNFIMTEKTLENIAKWALDGKSQTEIRNNLELTEYEWEYLKNVCPAMLLVMSKSTSYADMVIAGTLFQTAVGNQEYEVEELVKIKDYNDDGKCIGEHIEHHTKKVRTQPNPDLLKFLSIHKLSENFSEKPKTDSKEYKDVIATMSDDEKKAVLESFDDEQ
jgi:6-pyruvoyl-tetrahydropterin synthase